MTATESLNKLIKNKVIILLMALFFFFKAVSQTPGIGAWNLINTKANFNKKWNAFIELQTRSQKFQYDFYYYELKGALGYNISRKANFLIGTGQYKTYQYDGNYKSPLRASEIRLWEQLNLNNDLGKFKIEHRYRIEQRFFKNEYRNRFRYRLNVTLPVSKTNFYLNANEEVFLNDVTPYFVTNRAVGAMGYNFTKTFTLQCAYVAQFDFNKNVNPYRKNFFQTALLFDFSKVIHKSPQPISVED